MITDIRKANLDIQAILLPFHGKEAGQDYLLDGPAMSWALVLRPVEGISSIALKKAA